MQGYNNADQVFTMQGYNNADNIVFIMQGYNDAGQTEYALDSLRWIADYFVKNHHADLAFTGQIGNVDDDHSSWGRPEDMTESRPGFDLSPTAPGKGPRFTVCSPAYWLCCGMIS